MAVQDEDDDQRFGVTNARVRIGVGAVGGGALLWAVLFAAYWHSRTDAIEVASTTVFLTVPPLASYFLVMEITKKRLPLVWQIACTFAVGLLWLPIQRRLIGPAFGIDLSVGESVANFALLPVFGIASWLAMRSFFYRRRLARLTELQTQTELHLLAAQLAPHTLFNMLNTVYAVLLTDAQQAIPLFVSMSEALRHVVDRTRHRWIPLHSEIEFIEHYAVLERARSPERVRIIIESRGDLDVPVPPMLLATLFENASKHGRFPDGSLEVNVSIQITESQMRFDVVNRFPVPGSVGRGLGVGHANIKSRLKVLYPTTSVFRAAAERGIYRASISIEI
jgi:hypothetical protein